MRKASNAIAAGFMEYAKDQSFGQRLRLARVIVRGNWTFLGMFKSWGRLVKSLYHILIGKK